MIMFYQNHIKVAVKDGGKLLKQQGFFLELMFRCFKLG